MKCCDCITCARPDCIHRGSFRRLPREDGGLDLCPGHMPDTTAKIDAIKDEPKKHLNDIN